MSHKSGTLQKKKQENNLNLDEEHSLIRMFSPQLRYPKSAAKKNDKLLNLL